MDIVSLVDHKYLEKFVEAQELIKEFYFNNRKESIKME